MFLDGRDLRGVALEERRAELRRLIPRSSKSRLQFSEEIVGEGLKVRSRTLGSKASCRNARPHYRSGRVDTWRKVKCWTER
jgi:ATP-dependent DNA ligase